MGEMTFPKIPINRIVAWVGPFLAIAAGFVATWLFANVQVFGSLGIGHDAVANAIVKAATFAVSAGVVWLGHQKWLSGWIAHEARLPVVQKPL